jgi:DNA polymerase II small subunit/DNA polymerase delta subunit B
MRSIAAVVIIGAVEMQVESIRRMAEVVEEMKDSVDVFLMPSSNADRRRMFPLQPYNGNFFPRTQTQIGLCSNPQEFTAENGLTMHISCGENVFDFMRNCSLAKDELEVLEQMVNFSHYCPTSPFSLRTEPYL